jgi:DNA invertase Pin-like site-specific DNA recombinase
MGERASATRSTDHAASEADALCPESHDRSKSCPFNTDRLPKARCTKIFAAQKPGAVAGGLALHDAVEFARSGDTWIMFRPDRVTQSMDPLIETIESLQTSAVSFRQLTEAPNATTAQGRLIFHMSGTLAESQRSLIWDHRQPDRAAVCRPGRTRRCPCKLTDDGIDAAEPMLAKPRYRRDAITNRLGVES